MELLYPNMFMKYMQLEYEYYYFVTNYIVGKKIFIHSTIGYYIYVTKNINKFNNNQLVNIFENINSKTNYHAKYQPTDFFQEVDVMRKQIKAASALKKAKHLPKQHLEYLQIVNKGMATLRENILEETTKHLKRAHLENYLDLIDENIINIGYSTINKKFEVNDNEIGEIIYNNFITKEKLLILENILILEKEKDSVHELEETKKDKKDDFNVDITTLIEIPCPKCLSQSDLIIIRSQYIAKFNKLLKKIKDYNIENSKDEYNEISTKKAEIFGEKLIEEFEILQTEIENNIYFQKIRNSDKDYINVKIKMVLLPIVYILSVFNYMCVMSKPKVLELMNRVENEIGPEACEICIFYDIEPTIDEEENADEQNEEVI